MSAAEPTEPTFASPALHGVLPSHDLADVALPGAAAGGVQGTQPPHGHPGAPGRPPTTLSRRSRRRARIAAMVVLGVVVVAVAAALTVTLVRERAWAAVPADLDAPQEVNAVQLVLGSCVDTLPVDGTVSQVRAVPCGSQHGAQVVGRHDSATSAVWPGDDGAVRTASTTCGTRLLGTAGRAADDELRFVVWAPTEDSWADGDRTGLCLAATDSPRSGSLLD